MVFADKFDKFVVTHTAIGKGYYKTLWCIGSGISFLNAFCDNGNAIACPTGSGLVGFSVCYTRLIYYLRTIGGVYYNLTETCWNNSLIEVDIERAIQSTIFISLVLSTDEDGLLYTLDLF